MIKNIFALILISASFNVHSQKGITSFKNNLKTSSSYLKDVIPVVNKETGDIAFFVADAKNIYGYKIDTNFKVIDSIISEEKSRKYKVLIGSSASKNNSYRVFLTNKKQNKFSSMQFSFKDGTTSLKEFSLGEKEVFIQTVASKNQFYLISGSKFRNQLYIYSFDEDGNPKRHYVNTSNLRFIHPIPTRPVHGPTN